MRRVHVYQFHKENNVIAYFVVHCFQYACIMSLECMIQLDISTTAYRQPTDTHIYMDALTFCILHKQDNLFREENMYSARRGAAPWRIDLRPIDALSGS